MSDVIEKAKKEIEANNYPKTIAYALIAVAEELKQNNYLLDLIYQQTFNGINVYNQNS